jgi:hypothetical protein
MTKFIRASEYSSQHTQLDFLNCKKSSNQYMNKRAVSKANTFSATRNPLILTTTTFKGFFQ